MKNNKISLTLLIALVGATVFFTGCSDEDDPTPKATASTEQKLSFHLHTMVGNTAAAYGVDFQDAGGRKFNLGDFQYYISNIVLIKSNGSELPLSGKVVLANPARRAYELGIVPVGNYNGFKFILGLDSVTNHGDPTLYNADHPLAIQSPGVHWTWNSGYIFMKVEGFVDTTLAANGPADLEYFYHVGMDAQKRLIDFSTSAFTVTSGLDYEIGLEFDLLEILHNVDMRTENETHTFNNLPLAVKIADNWQGAFSIE